MPNKEHTGHIVWSLVFQQVLLGLTVPYRMLDDRNTPSKSQT